jgi:hypothetical protein
MPIVLLDSEDTLTLTDAELMPDGGDEGTSYRLRIVSPQVIKRIRRQFTKKRPTGGQGMADAVDYEAYGEALFDYVLESWSGPTWKGEPVGANDIIETRDQTTGEVARVKAKTTLDSARKGAMLERAGANRVVGEGRDDSFRTAS